MTRNALQGLCLDLVIFQKYSSLSDEPKTMKMNEQNLVSGFFSQKLVCQSFDVHPMGQRVKNYHERKPVSFKNTKSLCFKKQTINERIVSHFDLNHQEIFNKGG